MNKIGADGDLHDFDWGRHVLHQLIMSYREPLSEPWLDVGCGESWMRTRLRKIDETLHTSTADLDDESYAYPNDYFRTITSFQVIEHLYNPLFHMKEVRRVLHPDGRVFLSTENDNSLLCKTLHLFGWKYRPHFHQFSERDMRDLAERAGFGVRSIKKIRGLRSRIPLMRWLSRTTMFVVLSREPQ